MSSVAGWLGLVLITYITVGVFFVASGSKRAVAVTSKDGPLQAEATSVLTQSYRKRFLWVKEHLQQLPASARAYGARAVLIDRSCWAAIIVLFLLYGSQFVVP